MQKLKKSDREIVLTKVLTAAFEPRFLGLRDTMHAEVAEAVKQQHPRFVELYADEASRRYLYVLTASTVTLSDKRVAYRPVYGGYAKEPNVQNCYCVNKNAAKLELSQKVHLRVPSSFSAHVDTATTIAAYDKAWSDYTTAWNTLSALLNSYTTREALAADFPEFAVHVPLATGKVKLPAVIVGNVLAELAAVGVPAPTAA